MTEQKRTDIFYDINLNERERRLMIFALGRLDNLMGLMGLAEFASFKKDEIKELARRLGAKI